jgi:predicted fused transcriptional regulator/phosphomethylpyrimidine kinase
VPGYAEKGVAGHVATVHVAARAAGKHSRAALNVRYDETLVADLEAAGNRTVEFDAETDLESAIGAALEDDPGADALYQTGGFGIEPVCYVLGEDAAAVVTTVRDAI